MQESKIFTGMITAGLIAYLIYFLFFTTHIGSANKDMLKNTKYTVGIVTSAYYTNRGNLSKIYDVPPNIVFAGYSFSI